VLSPKKAFERVKASGPFDDPTEPSGPPKRWYFDERGVLRLSGWRDPMPVQFPEHRLDPNPQSGGQP
jgi:hypothetical protein